MPYDSTNQGQAKTEARPGQHISSIAHLFFDNQADEGGLVSSRTDCHILVVGTGRDSCAPYTAAGLGHHFLDQSVKLADRSAQPSGLPIRQVYLGEPSPVCFSGFSYLDTKTFRPPLAEETLPWKACPHGRLSILRLFPVEVPSEDFSGGMNDGRFYIRHFDLPREAELQALESQALSGHATGLGDDGAGGLVWCVDLHSAANLSLVARMGRLLKIVKPENLQVLVFIGREKGQPGGVLPSSSSGTDDLVERSRRLVEYVADKVPVHFYEVGQASSERAEILGELARQLSPF
jgi:hypothetical protein